MDAIEAIYRSLSQKGSSRWALDADIAKCFDRRRCVASYLGLTPSPFQSGDMARTLGITKAGNPRANRDDRTGLAGCAISRKRTCPVVRAKNQRFERSHSSDRGPSPSPASSRSRCGATCRRASFRRVPSSRHNKRTRLERCPDQDGRVTVRTRGAACAGRRNRLVPSAWNSSSLNEGFWCRRSTPTGYEVQRSSLLQPEFPS